jgi:hypothetical protein
MSAELVIKTDTDCHVPMSCHTGEQTAPGNRRIRRTTDRRIADSPIQSS